MAVGALMVIQEALDWLEKVKNRVVVGVSL
jgi:hypothetical protein